jgi:polygalacturonase
MGVAVAQAPAAEQNPWSRVPAILARIKPPVFPNRNFDITSFGAKGDGVVDCSEAFARAITACNQAGGGRVVVPAGKFLTGPIHLKSRVNLHVSADAVVLFSRDTKKYMPAVFTRWEGMECRNYSPFVYAFQQQDIAITGSGTLDGQADCANWWPWKGRTNCGWKKGEASQQAARDRLVDMCDKGTPVEQRIFGEGHYLRPQFIQPYQCRNILIEGVTIRNSPMWEINPVLSTNVTIRNVKVISHGPNNDGCDPESCTDVLIKDCLFDTGDDCIALKSGRNNDGRRIGKPIENVVIQGCEMKDGHGGVTIGSEISGGARNIFAEDCRMDSPNLDRVLRIKTNSVRGGTVENIYMRNVKVGQLADAALHVDFFYEEGEGGPHKPVVRNIEVSNLTCKQSKYALYLRGFKDAPIRDVRLSNCVFENVKQANVLENVQGLALSSVTVNGKPLTS